MATAPRPDLPSEVDAGRGRLLRDLLDDEAVAALRARLPQLPAGHPARRALAEVCALLEGSAAGDPERAPRLRPDSCPEELVLHPREREQHRHRLASLLGRGLHLLEGNEAARTIARTAEEATPDGYPQLCGLAVECARALGTAAPDILLVAGAEPTFTALADRRPFLCIHRRFVSGTEALSPAELCFALARQLQHVRRGHVALLQAGSERLEELLLEQFPFLMRTPIQLAARALGWTRANRAAKRLGGWLPRGSRSGRALEVVGDWLPDRDQETVLPEVVHDWVDRWLQGVELSADRAGLLAAESAAAACAALAKLSPAPGPRPAAWPHGEVRRRLREAPDQATADRLLELLRFALSEEYLAFLCSSAISQRS